MSANANANANALGGPPMERGYHKLASLMGTEKETAIFRSFGRLNMLNLMSLQAELMDLEDNFNQTCMEDECSGDNQRTQLSADFTALRESQGANALQKKALLDIRQRLKEYNTTLLQVAQVQQLSQPTEQEIKFLQDWLIEKAMGNSDIKGRQGRTWNADDLISLKSNVPEKAPFSSWVSGPLLRIFDRMWGYKHESWSRQVDAKAGLVRYDETTVVKYTKSVVTIIASLLPIVCTVVLYVVQNNGWRLGLMAMFTATFAAVLVIFTSAREIEVFASTAAFAAVEVVFIGTDLSNRTCV